MSQFEFLWFLPTPLVFLNLNVPFLPPKNVFDNYFFKKAFCPFLASSRIPDVGSFDAIPLAFLMLYLSLLFWLNIFKWSFFSSFLILFFFFCLIKSVIEPLSWIFQCSYFIPSSKICFIVFYNFNFFVEILTLFIFFFEHVDNMWWLLWILLWSFICPIFSGLVSGEVLCSFNCAIFLCFFVFFATFC